MYENAGRENKPRTDLEQKSDMFLNVKSLYKCHLGRAMTSTVISVRQTLGQNSTSWNGPQEGSQARQEHFLDTFPAGCSETHAVFHAQRTAGHMTCAKENP